MKIKQHWQLVVLTAVISAFATFTTTLISTKSSSAQHQAGMVPELLEQIHDLNKEINELKAANGTNAQAIYAYFQHMPFPAWLKIKEKNSFKIVKVNNKAQNEWGISELQFKKIPPEDIWGDEFARIMYESDLQIINDLEPITTWRIVPADPLDPDGDKKIWIVAKFPVETGGEIVTAVGGMAIPSDLYSIFLSIE